MWWPDARKPEMSKSEEKKEKIGKKREWSGCKVETAIFVGFFSFSLRVLPHPVNAYLQSDTLLLHGPV